MADEEPPAEVPADAPPGEDAEGEGAAAEEPAAEDAPAAEADAPTTDEGAAAEEPPAEGAPAAEEAPADDAAPTEDTPADADAQPAEDAEAGGDEVAPAEDAAAAEPTGEEAPPADGEAAPADEEAAPADGEAPPADEAAPTADGEAAPADEGAAPADAEAAPADAEAAPADAEAAPADAEAAPADAEAAPADAEAAPADEAAAPSDAEAAPADAEAAPAEAEAAGELPPEASLSKPVLVVCGPSGVGKGTLIEKLRGEYPDAVGFSISHTTRAPREAVGEQDGVHYHFVDRETIDAEIAAGGFLEYAEVHGNVYGTSLKAVQAVDATGRMCILDIDVQGLRKVRASAVRNLCRAVFVAPESLEALEERLRGRGTESEEKIATRMANAVGELEASNEPGLFDHVVVNGASLDDAYAEFVAVIREQVPGVLPDAPTEAAPEAQEPEPEPEPAPEPEPVAESVAPQAPPPGPVAESVAPQAPPPPEQTPAPPPSEPSPPSAGAADAHGPIPGAPPKVPVREYMERTVVPLLRKGMRALNAARPEDPVQYLADYLVAHKAHAYGTSAR